MERTESELDQLYNSFQISLPPLVESSRDSRSRSGSDALSTGAQLALLEEYIVKDKWESIGVGRCSDLGGRHFFYQQKCDFLEEQNAYMQYRLATILPMNEVHYANSG